MGSMKKILGRAAGILLALLVSAAAIEVGCRWFFTAFRQRFTFFDPRSLTLPPEKLPRAARVFSAELGWQRRFETPFGERPRARDCGRPLLATFGDSYTFGEQVGDKQTYQFYLSRRLKADVYNFGQGGYGTDQAYLYFQSRYPLVKTPLVSMGLITENINRIVNVFRPYYFSRTALALTKPRFDLQHGRLVLLPNPLQSAAELPKLADPVFIRSLGVNDWWYERDRGPELAFPYSGILFNKRLWMEALYGRGSGIDDIDPRPWEDLWGEERVRALLFAILDAFVSDARRLGATPLIVLSPRKGEVLEKFRGGEPASAARLLEFCRARAYHCFDGIGAMAGEARSEQEVLSFYTGHLNPRGNQLFAQALQRWLRRGGLVER